MQYPPYTTAGQADALGVLELVFRGRSSQPVKVTQVTCEMEAGAGAACSVRVNGALISPMVPTGDAAVGEPPVRLQPGDELTVRWTGAPPGATGRMVVIYEIEGAAA
jgi:protein involved in polysaccharide export with SLBB domain